jgi:hypothetical protein
LLEFGIPAYNEIGHLIGIYFHRWQVASVFGGAFSGDLAVDKSTGQVSPSYQRGVAGRIQPGNVRCRLFIDPDAG